jgi:signal transduction histidine kinase
VNDLFTSRRFWIPAVCWMARIIAGLLAALLLAFAIGQGGPPNPFAGSLPEAAETFAMFGIFLGLLIGLKWQGIGGILIIAGMIVFHIVERKFFLNLFFGCFELTAILYLISWYLKQISKKSSV